MFVVVVLKFDLSVYTYLFYKAIHFSINEIKMFC